MAILEIEQLVKWIRCHSAGESVFLSPMNRQQVDSYELLDYISEETGIDKQVIGRWTKEADEYSNASQD